jgi:putative sterol carrier protein
MSITPKEIFETKITDRIANHPDVAQAINAAYCFHIEGDGGGTWTVDLRKESGWVTSGDEGDPGCTIHCEAADFISMVTGEVPGPQLFMMGKLRIEGDMGLAMKLGQVLGAG